MRRGHVQLLCAVIAVAAIAAIAAIFLAPTARATNLVNLLTGLAWPLVLLAAVVIFWPQIHALIAEIVKRTEQGAALQVGIISVASLPEQAARIPSPGAEQPVSLENIALLHTSFLRADKTREFDDGRAYYQFEVIVIAPDDVLERVVSVQYTLEDVWPPEQRSRTVTDRRSRFKLKELANGTSIVNARVDLRDQDRPLILNRFIDLRPDGPRL